MFFKPIFSRANRQALRATRLSLVVLLFFAGTICAEQDCPSCPCRVKRSQTPGRAEMATASTIPSFPVPPWRPGTSLVPLGSAAEPQYNSRWLVGQVDYLMYWLKGGPAPPLVTTGNPADPVPGALGQPGTKVLYSGPLNYGTFSGVRLTLASPVDPDRPVGIEGNGFLLGNRATGFSATSNAASQPSLYVPIFAVDKAHQGSFAISDPQFPPLPAAGGISVSTSSQLWGAELNGIFRVWTAQQAHLDLLAGFRYLNLYEQLGLTGHVDVGGLNVFPMISDGFNTTNQFYGGQLGVAPWLPLAASDTPRSPARSLWERRRRPAIFPAKRPRARPALFGLTPGTVPGGFFTQPSNIGRQSRTEFGVVPALQLKLAYDITPRWKAAIGYDFTYWTNVVSPRWPDRSQPEHHANRQRRPAGSDQSRADVQSFRLLCSGNHLRAGVRLLIAGHQAFQPDAGIPEPIKPGKAGQPGKADLQFRSKAPPTAQKAKAVARCFDNLTQSVITF